MGRKARKQAKAKFSKYTVVTREDDKKLYETLDSVIARFHKTQLADARITLAYAEDVKADKEGGLMLHNVRIPSKVDKQLHGQDLIIILNGNFWRGNPKSHEPVLDEALCSIVPDMDKDGLRKYDAKDRPLYHVRKAPIRVFRENIKRYGFWQSVVEEFVRDTAPQLQQPEPTLFERNPAPRTDGPELTSPDAVAAIEVSAGRMVFGGFALTAKPKSGKALPVEEAKELIDRVQAFRDVKNAWAVSATKRVLADAGWQEVEEAPVQAAAS